jgi:hypothetical protein
MGVGTLYLQSLTFSSMTGWRPASSNCTVVSASTELFVYQTAYIADWKHLLRALDRHLVRESLDGSTGTLEVLIVEEDLLQFGVGLADVTKLVIPLVDNSVGQPLGVLTSLVRLSLTADDGFVVEGDGVVPVCVSACPVGMGICSTHHPASLARARSWASSSLRAANASSLMAGGGGRVGVVSPASGMMERKSGGGGGGGVEGSSDRG